MFDSIEKAQCLPTDDYKMELKNKDRVSTPEKGDVTVAKLQEVR